MHHRLIIAGIGLVIITAVVGGVVYFKSPQPPEGSPLDSFPRPSPGPPPAEPAEPSDSAPILGNDGFEADLVHSQWIATTPNRTYSRGAPVVNPVIVPKGGAAPLKAPVGNNFVGILNPSDRDTSGKLVHTAVAGPFPEVTVFQVTVFANRGRLAGASMPLFDRAPSEVLLQFFGWGAGNSPTINRNTDDWSRQPSVRIRQVFTNWVANGQWASQTFHFVTDKDLGYISLSIVGMNHKNASYVAFDVEAAALEISIPSYLVKVDSGKSRPPLGPGQGHTLASFRSVPEAEPATEAPIDGCFIDIGVEDNSAMLPLSEWLDTHSYRRPDDVDEEIQVGGTTGLQRSGHGEIFGDPFAIVFVPHDTVIYTIAFEAHGNNTITELCRQDFDRVLGSFHLVE